MVDPIISTKQLTKILMDGGSGLNLMYAKTLDKMGIDRTCVCPTRAPFHAIMPRKQAMSLGQIDLLITYGDPSNYMMETLTFEVVGFPKTFHAILGHPCYAKFIAVPNHATAIVAFGELAAIKKEVTEEAPNTKKSTGSFEPMEGSKEVLIDPGSPDGKVVCIGTMLSSK
ncbi:uncharacterized protein [Miscanthus floridulus]|uniref:uncharacterized protein n=1 Tax=Miscanthus floridulus TaxID=154761 RepID=UPI0034599522